MEHIQVLEKHFRNGMINKDFEAFKRTHPSLLKCILNAMNEVLPQANVIKSVCVDCKEEFKPIDRCVACENNRSINY